MMEHALLNDESESGQGLVGWPAGGMCGGERWQRAWKARVGTRAGFLKGGRPVHPISRRGRKRGCLAQPQLASPRLCSPPLPPALQAS